MKQETRLLTNPAARATARAIRGGHTSHDRLRSAIEHHGLDGEAIAARVSSADPGTTLSEARFQVMRLVEGGPATWPVAEAVLDLIIEMKRAEQGRLP